LFFFLFEPEARFEFEKFEQVAFDGLELFVAGGWFVYIEQKGFGELELFVQVAVDGLGTALVVEALDDVLFEHEPFALD
jgi:hypothetical protein